MSRFRESLPVQIAQLRDLDSRINGGAGSVTLRCIISRLDAGDVEGAQAEYGHDGDKLTQYPGVCSAVEEVIGCRAHGVIECKNWLCAKVRKGRS